MSFAAFDLMWWFLGLAALLLAGGKLMVLLAASGHQRWAYAVASVFFLALLSHISVFLAATVFPTALAPIAKAARQFAAATAIHVLVVWIWIELARVARSIKPQALHFFARLACLTVVCFGIGNWLLDVGTLIANQIT